MKTEKGAKVISIETHGTDIGMRENTPIYHWNINFIFNTGGMGDFVNYAAATLWIAKNCPWVHGQLIAPKFLSEIMKDIHSVNPNWTFTASEDFSAKYEPGTPLIGPDVHIGGVNVSHQFLTAVGAHPFDVGFAYYAGTTPPPAGAELPILDYPREKLHPKVKDCGKYAVISTGNVHEARAVSGKHINPIIDHVKSKGITPVFLGKRYFVGKSHSTEARFPDDVNYHEGIDLRDQTTVKQAATIMQHAEFTAGLDCGLLHLAALMKNSKVIFGYNVTSVAHRVPKRSHGKTINLTLSEGELKCIGCQSKLKLIAIHKFDKCLYGDTKCIDLLFDDRWKRAIDEILDEEHHDSFTDRIEF